MSATSERIADMKRQLAETKKILDGIVLHPSDEEGRIMLAQQLENNRTMTDLVEKMDAAFGQQVVKS